MPFDEETFSGDGGPYYRGLVVIIPSGKDEMAGHPGALGGGKYKRYETKKIDPRDSFQKKPKKEYSMKKAAYLTRFSAGTTAGPSEAMRSMRKMKSGMTMPRIHMASSHKPITGSASELKKVAMILEGFSDEILSRI